MTEQAERGLPLVALVGRPNVGKSTLFNRLINARTAIVERAPGVTRDRLYAPASWTGRDFLLADTGGITDRRDSLDRQVAGQSLLAAREADLIVMVVDAKAGLMPLDKEIADTLRRIGQRVLVAANKAEGSASLDPDFYALGLGEPLLISAEHGLGIGDLLDRIATVLPPEGAKRPARGVAVAVVGRPNVGKSTLVNSLLGTERVITSAQPGTTRDAIDTELVHDGRPYILIDTAGIRRAAKVEEAVEYYGVLRAIKAVERSDVVLLTLSQDDPATIQDQRIAGIALQAGKACLILVNKWDLAPKGDRDKGEYERRIRAALGFLDFAPVEFVSARTGQGVGSIMPLVARIADEYARRIPTARLNEVLNDAVLTHNPPTYKGRKLHLYYAAQVKTRPPVISVHVNDPELVHFSYQRYLENRFREAFGFVGTPLLLRFKARSPKKTGGDR